jgi:hypothetical protein
MVKNSDIMYGGVLPGVFWNPCPQGDDVNDESLMSATLINDMSVSDLLSLYEDSCDLEYYEMQEAIRLTLKRKCGEIVSQEEYDACIRLWIESGGTLHVQPSRDSDTAK